MSPNFYPNDFVITIKWLAMSLKEEQVVVVRHPVYQTIIKRIQTIDANGNMLLKGDNQYSVEMGSLGWIEPAWVVGKVLLRVPSK